MLHPTAHRLIKPQSIYVSSNQYLLSMLFFSSSTVSIGGIHFNINRLTLARIVFCSTTLSTIMLLISFYAFSFVPFLRSPNRPSFSFGSRLIQRMGNEREREKLSVLLLASQPEERYIEQEGVKGVLWCVHDDNQLSIISFFMFALHLLLLHQQSLVLF